MRTLSLIILFNDQVKERSSETRTTGARTFGAFTKQKESTERKRWWWRQQHLWGRRRRAGKSRQTVGTASRVRTKGEEKMVFLLNICLFCQYVGSQTRDILFHPEVDFLSRLYRWYWLERFSFQSSRTVMSSFRIASLKEKKKFTFWVKWTGSCKQFLQSNPQIFLMIVHFVFVDKFRPELSMKKGSGLFSSPHPTHRRLDYD